MITKEMMAEAMCELDADLVAEHIERTRPRKMAVNYALAAVGYAAACLVVVMLLPLMFGGGPDPHIPSNMPIDTGTYNSETMPPAPDTEPPVTETEPPVTDNDSTVTWEEIEKGRYADLMGYLEILSNYIHGPYSAGDYIGDKHLLHMCMLYAMQTRETLDTVVIDEAESIVTVSEEELDSLCRALFGDDVSVRDYDRHLFMYPSDYISAHDHYLRTGAWPEGRIGCLARFLKDGVYTFTTATDYWHEDPYNIDRSYDPIIEVEGEKVSVTVHLTYSPDLGEFTPVGQTRYTFTPVNDPSGHTRYRLLQIDGGSDSKPEQLGCVEEYVNATLDEFGNVIGFDWRNNEKPDGESPDGAPRFYMTIPSALDSAEGSWKNYLRWSPETKSYTRCLEYVNTFCVPQEAIFTLNGAIHEMAVLPIGDVIPSFEDTLPTVSMNRYGVPYVCYFSGSMSYIYFMHTVDGDRYITCFSYAVEDKSELMDFIDNVRITE